LETQGGAPARRSASPTAASDSLRQKGRPLISLIPPVAAAIVLSVLAVGWAYAVWFNQE
jgi:hypothetical protein